VRPSHIRRSGVVDDLDAGQLVGVGSWFRNELVSAEVGLLVEDAAQRQGIGTELLDVIVASARAAGITTLVATTLAEARHVHRMLGRVGPMTMQSTGFTTELHINLSSG
jgi:GNAT superfamily N-acetyltransferase